MKFIPSEIVDLIADYHDYNKYCKPKHEELFNSVLIDIKTMGKIMPYIIPNLVWHSWGPGAKYLENIYENESIVGLYDDDDEYEAIMSEFEFEGNEWNN